MFRSRLLPVRIFVLGLCLGPACRSLSQNSQTPAIDGLQGPARVEGVVVNALTGKPVPRALVHLLGGQSHAMLSGPQGEFTFENVPTGSMSFQVLKPGYIQEGASTNHPVAAIAVTAGVNKAVLKLVPQGVITGLVTDSDGEPMEGVQVMVSHAEIISGLRRVIPAGRNQPTDEDGNFRVAGLAPGRYYLSVRPGNATRRLLGARSGKRRIAYPAVVYYPAATEMDSATPLDLTAAQHVTVEFALKMVPAYKLSGTVTGVSEFKQVNSPWLTDRAGQVLASADTFDRGTGNFEFQSVPAGNYMVRIGAQPEGGQFTWAQRTVSLNADVANLRLALGAGTEIPVVVRNELSVAANGKGGFPGFETGSASQAGCGRFPVTVQLRPVDVGSGLGNSISQSNANSCEPKVPSVAPGKYFVQVFSLAGGYVQSLRSGGTNLLREELVVPTEGSVPPIEVTLRDDGGSVRIHVNSDQPAARSWAILMPEFAPHQPPVVLDIAPGSERDYGGLAPGDYKVFVFDSTDGLEYANPDALSEYGSKAARVSILPKGQSSVSAEVIHRE